MRVPRLVAPPAGLVALLAGLAVATLPEARAERRAHDPRVGADAVLGSDEPRYQDLRSSLATRPVEDALRILDELHATGRDPYRLYAPDRSFDVSAPRPPWPDEAPVLEAALRAPRAWSARLDVHVLRVAPETVESLLGRLDRRAGATPGVVEALAAETARRLLDAKSPEVRVEASRSIELFDGQSGVFHEGAAYTYAEDVDERTGALEVGQVREGTVLRCRVRRSASSGEMRLDVALRAAELRRPVELWKGTSPGEGPIELPELVVPGIEGSATVADGGWLLVGTAHPLYERGHVLVLVHVTGTNAR